MSWSLTQGHYCGSESTTLTDIPERLFHKSTWGLTKLWWHINHQGGTTSRKPLLGSRQLFNRALPWFAQNRNQGMPKCSEKPNLSFSSFSVLLTASLFVFPRAVEDVDITSLSVLGRIHSCQAWQVSLMMWLNGTPRLGVLFARQRKQHISSLAAADAVLCQCLQLTCSAAELQCCWLHWLNSMCATFIRLKIEAQTCLV